MRGDGRSGKVIQLVQTMGRTKKKKQRKGKVGKARGSAVIETLKGFLRVAAF